MLVVIEGPDGAGKTTLVELLRQNSASPYFGLMRSSGPCDRFDQVHGFMTMASAPYLDRVLCDRCPAISEFVYGPILRPVEEQIPLPFERVRDLIEPVNLLVYCRPPAELIVENCRRDLHMSGVASNIERIIARYDKLMLQLSGYREVVMYDFTNEKQSAAALRRIRHKFFGDPA